MTNHFHLLIETPAPNLSIGMHQLNGRYAAYFNERHRVDGHLFDRRFGSRLVETEEQLADTLRYIAFNPVDAGLCDHPRDWPWSSFYRVDQHFIFDR
jgi:REP element-mobilizing transposase RayT